MQSYHGSRKVILVWFGVLASLGAGYRTDNFVVEADHPDVARQIGEAAEACRKKIARQWLGHELPAWNEPCVLEVQRASDGKRGGASTFYFDKGRVLNQRVQLKGSLKEILPQVLPHELTHSILANHFGRPVPRWADEGTAILAEDEAEKNRRDLQMLTFLGPRDQSFGLCELFDLSYYPRDLRVFYAQSYSITRFLVERADHKTFTAFLRTGMANGWDRAVRTHYGYANVAQLEAAWKKRLRLTQLAMAAAQALPPVIEQLRTGFASYSDGAAVLVTAFQPLWSSAEPSAAQLAANRLLPPAELREAALDEQ